ncbi:dUTP diphosphatase, partial [Bilifractor sp. LCP19S3_H10]
DSHYTGSIVVKLYNLGNEDYVFEAGDKIVQIVFMPCGSFTMTQVDSLEATERGDKGFGSSGR